MKAAAHDVVDGIQVVDLRVASFTARLANSRISTASELAESVERDWGQ